MNRMRTLPLLLATVLALGACASTGSTHMLAADAPRALPAAGPVSVSWGDPAQFSEVRYSGNRQAASDGDWLTRLATYMREEAEDTLPAGHRLELTIVDIQRAGRYEPWVGIDLQDTRIIRDIYPPRMTLQFRELDTAGTVVAEGERKLSDPAFLMHASRMNDSDPLRYEKRMVDGWLRSDWRTASR
ncbi:MAG TPA: DUF3016 domain-containing protein [Thermomonas sp.]|nr:DUF3016 domain-containing protein [Thermomonas sp.]